MLAAAKEEAQISKLHRRINNIIAGNKMTLDQISESLINTPETEALKALDQLIDDGQVEADPPEPVYEVVRGVPRDCFQVQVFHHKDAGLSIRKRRNLRLGGQQEYYCQMGTVGMQYPGRTCHQCDSTYVISL